MNISTFPYEISYPKVKLRERLRMGLMIKLAKLAASFNEKLDLESSIMAITAVIEYHYDLITTRRMPNSEFETWKSKKIKISWHHVQVVLYLTLHV